MSTRDGLLAGARHTSTSVANTRSSSFAQSRRHARLASFGRRLTPRIGWASAGAVGLIDRHTRSVARPAFVGCGAAGPFLLGLHVHRLEVELAIEVREDYAVGALFALVIMDLSRRLRPHRSRPACLRCSSLESMGELALDGLVTRS